MRVAKGLNFSLLVFLGAQKEKRATTDQRDRYGEQSLCSSYSIIWFYCCAGIGKMADFKAPPSCRSPPLAKTRNRARAKPSLSRLEAQGYSPLWESLWELTSLMLPVHSSCSAQSCARAAFHSAVLTERPLLAHWNEFQVSFTPIRSSDACPGHLGIGRFCGLSLELLVFADKGEYRWLGAAAFGDSGLHRPPWAPKDPHSTPGVGGWGPILGDAVYSTPDQMCCFCREGNSARISCSRGSVTEWAWCAPTAPVCTCACAAGSGTCDIRDAASTSIWSGPRLVPVSVRELERAETSLSASSTALNATLFSLSPASVRALTRAATSRWSSASSTAANASSLLSFSSLRQIE
jgi:hypothetical protein